jgi:hypothetical protein
MAWTNLKQRSLADDLVSEHEALTELDDVNASCSEVRLSAKLSCLRFFHAMKRS